MYLVEIESGREQLFESSDALAAAIRGGLIGPQSRIFHRATSSWISITLHPEYRKVVPDRPAEPLPPLARNQWTFFGTESPTRQIVETAEPGAGQPAAAAEPATPRGIRRLFSRRRAQTPSPEAEGSSS